MSQHDPMRQALEEALFEDPNDLASHAAYADYLREQGDPRGEFIQVQLALEDPKRSPAERKKLQARERELLQEHQRAWLGELAPIILDKKHISEYYQETPSAFPSAPGGRVRLEFLSLPW